MFPEQKLREQAQKLKFQDALEKAFMDKHKLRSSSMLRYFSYMLIAVIVVYSIVDISLGKNQFQRVFFLRFFALSLAGFSTVLNLKPDVLSLQNREFWSAIALLFFSITHSLVLAMGYLIPNASFLYFTAYPFIIIGASICFRTIYFALVSTISTFVYFLSIFFSGVFHIENNFHFHANTINIIVLIIMGILVSYMIEYLSRSEFIAETKTTNTEAKQEFVLHKILPEVIAKKIAKELGKVSNAFETTTVMFADVTGFSQLSQNMPQQVLTGYLTEFEHEFQILAHKHGIDFIKTEGDYGPFWIISGLPEYKFQHAQSMVEMALDMRDVIKRSEKKTGHFFKIRIGIHSGPVVACWIGGEGLSVYDLYGDTLKVGKLMEIHGVTGDIHLSETTYILLKNKYAFDHRTEISVDPKTTVKTYILRQKL